jgi:hypothetical protein
MMIASNFCAIVVLVLNTLCVKENIAKGDPSPAREGGVLVSSKVDN